MNGGIYESLMWLKNSSILFEEQVIDTNEPDFVTHLMNVKTSV